MNVIVRVSNSGFYKLLICSYNPNNSLSKGMWHLFTIVNGTEFKPFGNDFERTFLVVRLLIGQVFYIWPKIIYVYISYFCLDSPHSRR